MGIDAPADEVPYIVVAPVVEEDVDEETGTCIAIVDDVVDVVEVFTIWGFPLGPSTIIPPAVVVVFTPGIVTELP